MAVSRAPSPDALYQAVKQIVPSLSENKSKGQSGKVAVVGGCREYTGAPYFASISALKIGADLSHVFCTEGAATVIKTYSPELIVHPYLQEEAGDKGAEEAFQLVNHWLPRFDVVVVGPGLGRDETVHATVEKVLRQLRESGKPIVIDADGLHIVKNNLDLVRGYDRAILTPNHNEFARLADALGFDAGKLDPEAGVQEVSAKLDGPIIVLKGPKDAISDGRQTIFCAEEGSKRRAGGQGDVLSGSIAAFSAWTQTMEGHGGNRPADLPPLMLAAYGGCYTCRHAQKTAFEKKRRSMVAGNVIEELGYTVDRLFDS